MIAAYLPKLYASGRFDMRISNCSEYMKLRQNHATCRLWKTLEPQICLRCLWKCFQRVQRPQIDLQLTWFGLQNIHFGDTNDILIFSDFLAFRLCLSPPFWPGSYIFWMFLNFFLFLRKSGITYEGQGGVRSTDISPGDHWICRMFTRAYAFEKLYPESNPENSFYGCTTRKFLRALEFDCVQFWVSQSAQNHGILVPQMVCGKSFIMRTTETSKWVEMLWDQGMWLQTTIVTK